MYLKFETHPTVDDLISMTDLMFRWQHEPAFKILTAMQRDKPAHSKFNKTTDPLKFYVVNSSTDSVSGVKKIELSEWPYIYENFLYFSTHFNELVFFRDEIEAVEEVNKHFTVVPDKPDKDGHLQQCTIDNVSQLAPQLLYTLLSLIRKNGAWRASVRERLYASEVESEYAIFDFAKTPKPDWIIPHNRLWPKYHLPNHTAFKVRPLTDSAYQHLHEFVQDKREKGFANTVKDNDLLLGLISEYVPLLTDMQLGDLIPASPGMARGDDTSRKRGEWLRRRLNSSIDREKLLKTR